jgi:type I restriction enzyme M protein
MKQNELEKYLWGAAVTLRGKIDAGDYKQYIFPLLFLKRICDVYDEEFVNALSKSNQDSEYAAFGENHRFQIPAESNWNKVRESTVNVGATLQDAMISIEKANPDTLSGIFGDAPWTNKERLSDEILINLIEHYSKYKLNLSDVPDDQLGNAYEYLIKKFADDSGHTAAEFYTNRTVVKLMTMIMNPQPGESVYDPTCGSGGLLLNCALHLKSEGKEYRTLKLYGQEINLITSSIARMNMFLHGIEEFDIVRGDTLVNPAFIEKDKLKKFNVILANPPYSIKSWNKKSFENDPFGRNIWGTPPQGCADYAFQQHIQKSLDDKNGRSCVLWPYGVLFRETEYEIRKKMIENDLVECVISLGKNLFYNSTMESCLLITNNNKPKVKKNKILFIDAREELKKEKTISYLLPEHMLKIYNTFIEFKSIEGFSYVADISEVLKKEASLNIPLYVKNIDNKIIIDFSSIYNEWLVSSDKLKKSLDKLFIDVSKKK